MKTQRLDLSVFTKNGTRYFWLFNNILWLWRGLRRTHGSCSWMVKIERYLPSEFPRTAARRTGRKTLVEQAVHAVCWDPSLRRAQLHEYGMTISIVFAQVHVFAVYTSIFLTLFSKSPLRSPHPEVFILPMRFHHIGVNKRPKWWEMSPFLPGSIVVVM